MAEFVSEVKTIPYSDAVVYAVVSDLRNLDAFKSKVQDDRMKDIVCDKDSCEISVDPLGKIRFVIIERQPDSTIKFEAEKVPFDVNMWIQLERVSDNETKMKLTVRADVNPFIKPMISKPLQQALDKIAEIIATIPYDQIKGDVLNS